MALGGVGQEDIAPPGGDCRSKVDDGEEVAASPYTEGSFFFEEFYLYPYSHKTSSASRTPPTVLLPTFVLSLHRKKKKQRTAATPDQEARLEEVSGWTPARAQ